MIIYFEGQSCAGKTTLIDRLHQKYKNIHIIRELPIGIEYGKDINELCKSNDIDKVAMAHKLNNLQDLVLVDRAYLSTLCYSYLKYHGGNMPNYAKEIEWFINNRAKGILNPPDLYVYMTISLECSDKRVITTGRKDWFKDIAQLRSFYECYFKYIEIDIPVLQIDGENRIEINENKFIEYCKTYFNFLSILHEGIK